MVQILGHVLLVVFVLFVPVSNIITLFFSIVPFVAIVVIVVIRVVVVAVAIVLEVNIFDELLVMLCVHALLDSLEEWSWPCNSRKILQVGCVVWTEDLDKGLGNFVHVKITEAHGLDLHLGPRRNCTSRKQMPTSQGVGDVYADLLQLPSLRRVAKHVLLHGLGLLSGKPVEEVLATDGQLDLLSVLERLIQQGHDVHNTIWACFHRIEIQVLHQFWVMRL